jgi:hypothetical protein
MWQRSIEVPIGGVDGDATESTFITTLIWHPTLFVLIVVIASSTKVMPASFLP